MNPELADRCPECVARRPARPHSVVRTGPESVRADYRCRACGHEWFTGWLVRLVA